MAIKIYNPTSPGRRDASTLANEEITKDYPEKKPCTLQEEERRQKQPW
jgi:ribosomal protein L2